MFSAKLVRYSRVLYSVLKPQICRKRQSMPFCARDMCSKCIHPSKFLWVAEEDSPDENLWAYSAPFPDRVEYIRFDDIMRSISRYEDPETANRVERELHSRKAILP